MPELRAQDCLRVRMACVSSICILGSWVRRFVRPGHKFICIHTWNKLINKVIIESTSHSQCLLATHYTLSLPCVHVRSLCVYKICGSFLSWAIMIIALIYIFACKRNCWQTAGNSRRRTSTWFNNCFPSIAPYHRLMCGMARRLCRCYEEGHDVSVCCADKWDDQLWICMHFN